MKKVLGGMLFLLLFLPLFAEPQSKDLYIGKWSNGNATIVISEGLTGLVVKYGRPEQGKMLITQEKKRILQLSLFIVLLIFSMMYCFYQFQTLLCMWLSLKITNH